MQLVTYCVFPFEIDGATTDEPLAADWCAGINACAKCTSVRFNNISMLPHKEPLDTET